MTEADFDRIRAIVREEIAAAEARREQEIVVRVIQAAPSSPAPCPCGYAAEMCTRRRPHAHCPHPIGGDTHPAPAMYSNTPW